MGYRESKFFNCLFKHIQTTGIYTTCILYCIINFSIAFLNIFKLLAFTQSGDNLFHSFLYENEYFLISNLHITV